MSSRTPPRWADNGYDLTCRLWACMCLFGCLLATLTAVPGPAAARTIDEAMLLAAQAHSGLEAEELEAEAADREVGSAISGYFPTLSVDGSLRREETQRPNFERTLTANEYSVTLSQPIFDGLATPARVSEARSDAQAARFEAAAALNQVAYEAADAYLTTLETQERLRVLRAQETRTREIHKRLERRAAADSGLRSIVVVGRSQVDESRFLTLEAEHDLALARARYTELVGEMPDDLTEPPEPMELLSVDEETALARATATHPMLAAAQSYASAAAGTRRIARADLMPRLDAELKARKGRNIEGIDGRDNEMYAGLRLTYRFATGGEDFYDLSAANYREKAALARIHDVARDVRLDVLAALEAYRSNTATHSVLASRLGATTELTRVYDAQFVSGRRDLLDLFFVLNEERSAARAEIEARFARLRAAYSLLAAMGDLGPSLAKSGVSAGADQE